jgi:hypothetical protein
MLEKQGVQKLEQYFDVMAKPESVQVGTGKFSITFVSI